MNAYCVASRGVVVALLLMSCSTSVFASGAQQMSFEEAVRYADVVAIGTVTEKPEYAQYDATAKEVLRRNRVHVERYLKGTGGRDITVVTFGGQFLAETDHGREEQFVNYGGLPQLSEAGADVLLFLKPYGGGGSYVIASATHGVVAIQSAEKRDDRTVQLLFRDAAIMPARAKQLQEESKSRGSESGQHLFPDQVTVEALPDLVQRALKARAGQDREKTEAKQP